MNNLEKKLDKETKKRKKPFVKPEIKIINLGRYAKEQLKYYSDTKLSDEKITEIFLKFKEGKTPEEVEEDMKREEKGSQAIVRE